MSAGERAVEARLDAVLTENARAIVRPRQALETVDDALAAAADLLDQDDGPAVRLSSAQA